MPSTVRGEVRSHINYFFPHPPVAGLSTPYHTSQPLTHTNGIGNGLETNLSFSFPPYSLPYKYLSLSHSFLSLCGFSRISSPYFSPFPSLLPRTLMPYGKSIFRRSPHCRPCRPEGRRSCNVFATYFISSTHLVITIVSRNQARPLGNTIYYLYVLFHSF